MQHCTCPYASYIINMEFHAGPRNLGHVAFVHIYVPTINCSIYYNVHYLHLLIVIS